jgi:hypothetical protein
MRVKIIEGGMTIAGKIIRAGDVFDVDRKFKNGLGEPRLCLSQNGVVILPNTDPGGVEVIDE